MTGRRFGFGALPNERAPVQWFKPSVLASAALEVVFSAFQNRHLDRREAYGVVKPLGFEAALDFRHQVDDFWFDFLSDTGDGGNATYSVLLSMLGEHVRHGDQELPRGKVLVLGGDLAYPEASPSEYQYRFIDLFLGANRGSPSRTAALVGIPQNHDWMDNLSTFSRYLVSDQNPSRPLRTFADDIPVLQRATYFALALPHNWWIFGLDFASAHDIDRNQFESMRLLVDDPRLFTPDASVILLYPEPVWTASERSTRNDGMPKRYQRLEAAIGIGRIRLRLAGDLHQFTDQASDEGDRLIICGTGGAFAHPTHPTNITCAKTACLASNELAMNPEAERFVRVYAGGPMAAAEGNSAPLETRRYSTAYQFPAPGISRRKAWSLPFVFGWHNWQFAIVLGIMYWLNSWLNALLLGATIKGMPIADLSGLGLNQMGQAFAAWFESMVFQMPSAIWNLLMVGLCAAFSRGQSRAFAWAGGLVHGLVHAFAVFLLYWDFSYWTNAVPLLVAHPAWRAGLGAIWMLLGGAVVGSLLFGGFLSIAVNGFGQHQNEAFSALSVEDYKGFLRFKIGTGGMLTGHYVQIEKVCRRWERSDDAAAPAWRPSAGAAVASSVGHSFYIAPSAAPGLATQAGDDVRT